MTVFALHPEAIMQGRIITSGWKKLLTGKIHYVEWLLPNCVYIIMKLTSFQVPKIDGDNY